MAVNYQKLWNILSQRNMTRSELREVAGVTTNAMVKLGKNESVQIEVLAKICCALDCTLDDIVDIEYDHYSTIPLPDIDLSDFASANEFETMGFSEIKDVVWPFTRKCIKEQLTEHCSWCILSYDACKELLAAFDTHGIHIDFPDIIEPDLNFIPATHLQFSDASEEDKEVVYHKLFNCVRLALRNTGLSGQNLIDWLTSEVECKDQHLVENGKIEARMYGNSVSYHGATVFKKSAAEIYPLNLLGSIFGITSTYCFANRIKDCTAIINEVLDTITPEERFWVELKYRYGITNESMLKALNLPNYETLLWILNNNCVLKKAIRKMRHPSRAKKLRSFIKTSPYDIDYSSLGVYYDWQTEVEKNIISAMESGVELSGALSEFYDPYVVEKVMLASNKWKGVPVISIDSMDLSWKTCAALDQANIRTLDELWFAHGKHLSLSDIKESGLANIAGIGMQQITELLEKMAGYQLLPISVSHCPEIVGFAEKLASGGVEKPSIACCCIPHVVLRYLLSQKYRKLDDVITDYVESNLGAKIKQQEPECSDDVIGTLDLLLSNQYPVMHLNTSGFWEEVLEKNGTKSLEDIRSAYLLDQVIKGKQNDLQIHISSLFPTEPIEFKLTYRTRARSIHWILWPVSLFRQKIKKSLIPECKDANITKAYYALDGSYNGGQWIAAEATDDANVSYHFFSLNDSGLHPVLNMEPQIKASIFDAIMFNAELFSQAPVIQENIAKAYVDAQVGFCKIYGTHTATEEDQNFFKEYKPCILVNKLPKVKLAENISIDELDLSVRSYNCLMRANIKTVGDFLKLSSTELVSIRNIGKKSLIEILNKVKAIGAPIKFDVQQLYEETKKDVEQIQK